jgi:hypothetical protein
MEKAPSGPALERTFGELAREAQWIIGGEQPPNDCRCRAGIPLPRFPPGAATGSIDRRPGTPGFGPDTGSLNPTARRRTIDRQQAWRGIERSLS